MNDNMIVDRVIRDSPVLLTCFRIAFPLNVSIVGSVTLRDRRHLELEATHEYFAVCFKLAYNQADTTQERLSAALSTQHRAMEIRDVRGIDLHKRCFLGDLRQIGSQPYHCIDLH